MSGKTCGDVHAMCGEKEYDENGVWTGAACMKSEGHDDPERNYDFRRRAHFDAASDAVWWSLPEKAATS